MFAVFFAATFLILYGWFLALKRAYQPDLLDGGLIFIGRQAIKLPVERILNFTARLIFFVIALATGAGMMAEWVHSRFTGMLRKIRLRLSTPSSASRFTFICSLFRCGS